MMKFKQSIIKNHEIALCKKCGGKGSTLEEVLSDYHRGKYHYDNRPCYRCNGTGRVKIITTIEEVPYIEDTRGETPPPQENAR
jgi:DnaJ-class molecular chaperone